MTHPTCKYTTPATRRGECECPKCDAPGCEECIAHLRPMSSGGRYCDHHSIHGFGSGKPQGLMSYINPTYTHSL